MKTFNVKRFFVIFLTVCLISGSIGFSSSATEETDMTPPAQILSQYVNVDELRQYIFESFKECTTDRIALTQYNLPVSVSDALKNFIWRDMPECFQADELSTISNGKIIKAISVNTFRYANTKDEYVSMIAECEKKAAEILDGIKDNDSLSDMEKALLIHDRFAVRCTYCNDTTIENRYNIYGGLVLGLAVCDGYTQSYAYLLRLAGIENVSCMSMELDHSWNIVLIDGKYYHVDVTWDDPLLSAGSKSLEGHVMHKYFLLSDKEIRERKHNANDYNDTLAPDTKYDGYFWENSETEFQLVDGQIYYLDNASAQIKRINSDKKSGTALYTVDDTWWTSGRTAYFDGNYSRLSSGAGYLFFSTSDTVYLYDLKHDKAVDIFKPELKNDDPIYGFTYYDGYLVCDICDRPAGSILRLEQIKQKYTPDGIYVKLSLDNAIQSSRTVVADITSKNEIKGYYFGTNSEFDETDAVLTNESRIEITVTKPGTYYFAVYDENGERSEIASYTFCLINLHTNGGTVPCDKILIEKSGTFVLPIPENGDLYFRGWAETDNAEYGKINCEITDPPLSSDFYAVWKEDSGITCEVKTLTNDVTVTITLLDENGDVIDTVEAQPGELTFSVTDDTAFIIIAASGYAKKTFKIDAMPDTEIILTLLGDTNKDNELNNKDVVILFRFVSGAGSTDDDSVYDFNEDGETNNKDVVALFRTVSN